MRNPQEAGEHTRVESIVPLAALTDEAFRELCSQVLVLVTHRLHEGIHPSFFNHAFKWAQIGLTAATLSDPHGGFIEVVRGHAERMFLSEAEKNPNLKYIVMADNDQMFDWDAPLRLAAHGKPVTSGVICGYNPERGIFGCFTSEDDKGVPRFATYRFTKRFPGKGLKKVHQVGTGLVAIRRDVFETLVERGEFSFMVPEYLRKESYRAGHIKQGEDFSFCDKVREAGFDIYVDFTVRGLHYKPIGLGWPEELVDDDLDANDWNVSNLDFRGLKHI